MYASLEYECQLKTKANDDTLTYSRCLLILEPGLVPYREFPLGPHAQSFSLLPKDVFIRFVVLVAWWL